MAKVDGERLAPDPKVSNVEDGQIFGQRQYNCLAIVATQRILLAILIGYAQAVGRGTLATAHPELGVCKWKSSANVGVRPSLSHACCHLLTWRLAVVAEVGHQQRLGIHNDNVIGRNAVHASQCADLLGTGKV